MGQKSCKRNETESLKSEFKIIDGLSPIENLKSGNYDIETLVFSGGGAKDYSYHGAVDVLEKVGILQKIKRFTGVGTGAIVATILAVGFDCNSLRYLYNQLSDYLQIDDYVGCQRNVHRHPNSFGWNTGETFLDWLGQMFESKAFESELTFMKLYEESSKELCIVLTDISKVSIEYCHPKTTPNLSIREAVFMSLTIPGIHNLRTFKSKNVYANGGLLCNYPIHAFDGWWLSMRPEDSLMNRIDAPSQYHTLDQVFHPRNLKSLGFVLLDKYTVNGYKELKDRLNLVGGQACIPDTCNGKQYKLALFHQQVMEERFNQLRQVSLELCRETVLKTDEYMICEETLARGYLNNSISSKKLSHLIDKSFENCLAYLKRFEDTHSTFCSEWLEHVFKKRILSMLEEISNFYMTKTNNISSFFCTLFDIMQQSTMNIEKADYIRTIGIPCGHVITSTDLADDDKTFLYRQGWNATVAYLKLTRESSTGNIQSAQISP